MSGPTTISTGTKPTSSAIGNDLDLLRSLPPSALRFIRQLVSSTDTSSTPSQLTANDESAKAIDLIETFRPTKSTSADDGVLEGQGQIEAAQALARAYMRDMTEVRGRYDPSLDRLGEWVDDVRDKAGRVGEALADVKV